MVGKSVVITGATGIAAASAHRLRGEGAELFVVSRHESELEELTTQLEEYGPSVGWAAADLTSERDVEGVFARALDHLGAIDGLFAVAGASGRRYGDGPTDRMTFEAWEKTISINLSPAFLATREAIRAMIGRQQGGSVVCVGSVLAEHPSPRLFATHAYAASKGAIASFVRATASYYAPDRIRVNAVAPGLVRTPMADRAAGDPEVVAYAEEKQPLAGGLLDPGAVADTALFLLSDEAGEITGQVIDVDGGWSVTEARE
jgi:NAD(P)-dependent dehydrogenase (short-subunit alcohol dehydrogenase family)